MTPTVTKIGNRWVLEGEIWAHSNHGRTFGPEPYFRAFRTRKAAEEDIIQLDRFNAMFIDNHQFSVACRAFAVLNYLAARAARKAATPVQLALAF